MRGDDGTVNATTDQDEDDDDDRIVVHARKEAILRINNRIVFADRCTAVLCY
jgi:hypothetical protein